VLLLTLSQFEVLVALLPLTIMAALYRPEKLKRRVI